MTAYWNPTEYPQIIYTIHHMYMFCKMATNTGLVPNSGKDELEHGLDKL